MNFFKPIEPLITYYDTHHWWDRENLYQLMIEAILIQNTNFKNVDQATANLTPYLAPPYTENLQQLVALPLSDLETLIKPSGIYHVKAQRLQDYFQWFSQYDYDFQRVARISQATLRQALLAIKGIGPETCDVLMLFTFQKPMFIADNYARRLYQRLGMGHYTSYPQLQKAVMQSSDRPTDVRTAQAWHAAIDSHAQAFCRVKPVCQECPLLSSCPFGQQQVNL